MKNEKGQSLVEVLIALAILGIVAVSFLTALAMASTAVIVSDEQTTAESLARSELEYVRSQTFSANPWSYAVSTTSYSTSSSYPSWWDSDNPHTIPPEYQGYSVAASATGYDADGDGGADDGIWEITVEVYHSDTPGADDDLVLATSTYKVNR